MSKTNFIAGAALLLSSMVPTPADAKCVGPRCWIAVYVLEEGVGRGVRMIQKYVEKKKQQRTPGICRAPDSCNDPGKICQDLPGGAPHCGRSPGSMGAPTVSS